MFDYRLPVYSPQDNFLFEISPNDVFSGGFRERINGEHSMTITTSVVLEKEQRILIQDKTEKWREFVISGTDRAHQNGERPFGTYNAVWSLQHDFKLFNSGDFVQDGDLTYPIGTILDTVLSGTNRWKRGTISVVKRSYVEIIQKNGWEALTLLCNEFGVEVDAQIDVDTQGVVSRKVCLYDRMGNNSVTRRFDYSRDLISMSRKVDEMPVACRVRPYGKTMTTVSGYKVKVTVEDELGVDYIQDDEMVPILRLSDGNGGYEYPTTNIENSSIEDPEELVEWARSVMTEYTRPKVTYSATVSQFYAAGMDVHGVELGDVVHCVDRGFSDEGIRIESRVIQIDTDLFDPTNTKLTLGDLTTSYVLSISGAITNIRNNLNDVSATAISTAEYVDNILDNLNEEINATGGYFYIIPGQGVRTYDKEVSNPAIGAEADSVVEIRGGNIRIANSRKATGEWNWRTVFTSGHIVADMVTAVNATTGFIGNASGGSYWDLDNNTLTIGGSTQLGSRTVTDTQTAITNAANAASNAASAASDARKYATNYLTFNTANGLDVGYSGTSAKTRISASGMEVFDGAGNSALYVGLSGSTSIVRVGRASGSGNVVMSSEGYVDVRNASTVLAHFGWGLCRKQTSTFDYGPYYNIGTRKSSTEIGMHSLAEGFDTTASGDSSHAEGCRSEATDSWAHAEGYECKATNTSSHAEGYRTKATGSYSHADGYYTEATSDYSHASGYYTKASQSNLFVCGKYNNPTSRDLFEVGYGASSQLKNALRVTDQGHVYVAQTLYAESARISLFVYAAGYVTESDRRLKQHHAYLGEDACDFIRALKPALYTKDGARHTGFYAQDVQEAEPDEWDTATVTAQHTDESLDFDPLTLDYSALIAPLTAYAQQLEKRVDGQQAQIEEQRQLIESLTERIDALEGRLA